jgi:ribose transport system substrate-binding protein
MLATPAGEDLHRLALRQADTNREDLAVKHVGRASGLALTGLLLSSVAVWAGPKIVSGPGANAACFKPWSEKTKFFQWDKQPGPYKIALVNGFVGNT